MQAIEVTYEGKTQQIEVHGQDTFVSQIEAIHKQLNNPPCLRLIRIRSASQQDWRPFQSFASFSAGNADTLQVVTSKYPYSVLEFLADFLAYAKAHPELPLDPSLRQAIQKGNRQQCIPFIIEQFGKILFARFHEVKVGGEPEAPILSDREVELQRRIAEDISRTNIEENMRTAYENTPEVFTAVTMLYINMEINGVAIQAFVDTGAQATIMTSATMRKCNISYLLDEKFSGKVVGVGEGQTIGRIHSVDMKVGDHSFQSSLTIFDVAKIDMIIGLDLLRRHSAVIDLSDNVLRIGSAVVPFLSEAEINTHFGISSQTLPESQPMEGVEVGGSQVAPQVEGEQEIPLEPVSMEDSVYITAEGVQSLMELGCPEALAQRLLVSAKGDASVAASLFFAALE